MRIAVFDTSGTSFVAPVMQCMLQEFAGKGFKVDLYLRNVGGRLESLSARSCVMIKPFPTPLRLWEGDVRTTISQWRAFGRYNGLRGLASLLRGQYDLAFGLNPEGVIAAHRLWRKKGTPFIYLSFEMMFMDELRRRGHRKMKEEEVAASRDASLVVIQDPWRAALLQSENHIPAERFAYLPVAPRAKEPITRTNYLRERFGIPQAARIVINSGTFNAFTRADDIIQSVTQWPPEFHLIVNTHYTPRSNDTYIRRLRDLNLPNVHISEGSLAPEEHEQMLLSADIGLAYIDPWVTGHFTGETQQLWAYLPASWPRMRGQVCRQ